MAFYVKKNNSTGGHSSMKSAVTFRHLLIKTKDRNLLELEEMNIPVGSRQVIFGPSGAGKSTLLKCIATLQPFSSGEVMLFDKKLDKKNLHSLRNRMVYVAQHEVLFNGDVGYNVGLGLSFRKIKKEERQTQIRQVLKLVGLEGYEKRNVESLSGGEIQRVALARALVLKPELLLLDEPTANLDPFNVQLMERAILHYCENHGATLILATHNMNQAKRMGQQGIFIVKGKPTETGTIPALIDNPSSHELREFLEWV
jgi:tungstate transport system ATP-binding protein